MIFNSYSEGKESLAGISIVSCGHVFANPGREVYRPNGRDDWLLFYVAKESETFFLDRAVELPSGAAILFAPGEKQHHIYSGSRVAEFYYVHFKCDTLPEGFSLETSHIYALQQKQQVVSIFEEMIDEALQKNPHYELLCVSDILRLLSMLQMEGPTLNESAKKPWKSIAYAVQHMNRYCDSDLKLEHYAAMCCMSKYHFLRVFKEVTGSTPVEYRNTIRVKKAEEMLENGQLSISEIGEALGYSSPAYFSDAFKKETGVSPQEYRKKLQSDLP